MSAASCTCERPHPNVLVVCDPCARANVERFYAKYPGVKDFQPDPALDLCCQRDQVADEFGWDAAMEWDTLRYFAEADR